MSRFKIGQRVVSISTGNEYVVDGLTCCSKCGVPCINLVGKHRIGNVTCVSTKNIAGCGGRTLNVREFYDERCFAPLEEIESAIENLMEQSNLITK